jgi:hypothetical protein
VFGIITALTQALRGSTLLALSAALATAAITPTVAAKRGVVTVPKSALKESTSKLCMPRSTSLTAAKDKTLPETL